MLANTDRRQPVTLLAEKSFDENRRILSPVALAFDECSQNNSAVQGQMRRNERRARGICVVQNSIATQAPSGAADLMSLLMELENLSEHFLQRFRP